MTLAELAERLGAELAVGEAGSSAAGTEVTGVAGIESAGDFQVTFVANPKYAALARTTAAAALIVEPGFAAIAQADFANQESVSGVREGD